MKNRIINQLNEELESKIKLLNSDINSLKESKNNDTKSSAGDKYETSREMAQIELNKLETLLNKTKSLKNELSKIDSNSQLTKIDIGAVVMSNQENFFISIPMVKIEIDGVLFYPISLESPLGIELKGKISGDKIKFRDREIIIQNVF